MGTYWIALIHSSAKECLDNCYPFCLSLHVTTLCTFILDKIKSTFFENFKENSHCVANMILNVQIIIHSKEAPPLLGLMLYDQGLDIGIDLGIGIGFAC